MKNSNNNSLPFAMELAEKTQELDYIKVIPETSFLPVRKRFFVFKLGDYKKRLLSKAANFINNDISVNLSKNKESKFHVYIMGVIKDFKIIIISEHSYKIN